MLEKLQKKFKQELAAVEEDESNKQQAYDLEMLHLTNSIDAAKEDRSGKSETKSQRAMDSAEAKSQLADAQADLAAAEKYLTEVTQTLRQKRRCSREISRLVLRRSRQFPRPLKSSLVMQSR